MSHSPPVRPYSEPAFIEPADGPLTVSPAGIRYCPWCGVPLRNERGELLAEGMRHGPALRTGRQDARSIVANDATLPDQAEPDPLAFHVCEKMPGPQALRTFSVPRFLPPSSAARTPSSDDEPSDALIDRIIFGVFVVIGLLALVRFILTH